MASHVEVAWTVPAIAAYFRSLASFCRRIRFDKRGTGMSDRVSGVPSLETRMDDVRAVMDAAGSECAALIGQSEGGPMCTLFAATYPRRTWALVLKGLFARASWAHDYPWGRRDEEQARVVAETERLWGTAEYMEEYVRAAAPSADEENRRGLHAGECEIVDGKIGGIAVHIGARVASNVSAGEVVVSSTPKDLVAGSGIPFTERAEVALKGIPGEWRLFAVDRDGALN
jgi:pimeloyl-ACP methyl ester carboxylesterase